MGSDIPSKVIASAQELWGKGGRCRASGVNETLLVSRNDQPRINLKKKKISLKADKCT